MSRILMVTHGSGGDIIPFVRLAAGLIERPYDLAFHGMRWVDLRTTDLERLRSFVLIAAGAPA